MNREQIESTALRVADEHGCHTVLLYGSWARGDATETSDVDLLMVRDEGAAFRDARLIAGVHFDIFVYPGQALSEPEESLLRILGGRVLRELEGFGAALLRRVQELFDRGPRPLPKDESNARILWAHKMLERLRGPEGPESRYRRMSLLVQALEDYFALRTLWFPGSKEGFAWLSRNDPEGHEAFVAAMRPLAADEALVALVSVVYGPPRAGDGS